MVVRGRLVRDRWSVGARGRWRRSALAVGATGAVALGLLAAVPVAPVVAEPLPGVTARGNGTTMAPVDLAQAGEFVGWGRNVEGQTQLPAELQGVALRKVVAESNVTLALTADGRVVAWGYNSARLQAVPADVQSLDVVDIAMAGGFAGVVTGAGTVRIWGQASELHVTPLEVPPGLSGVKQLVFPGWSDALALLQDGTVVGWGKGEGGVTAPPPGLKATAITGVSQFAYAITEAGTVVGWGMAAGVDLPDAIDEPAVSPAKEVVAISAVSGPGDSPRGLAQLRDGSLVPWGIPVEQVPVVGSEPVVAISSYDASLVLTEDGILHPGGNAVGGNPTPLEQVTPPAAAQGRAVAQFSVGGSHVGMIVTKMLRAAAPAVAGAPTVGSTLTGTPGTFSAVPDQVTSVWLADGQPIVGAEGASLTLTTDLLGKQISYRSTATKTGEETISSTSTATAPVARPAPPVTPPAAKVGSSTAVGKVTIAKAAKKVVVTAAVSAASSPAGQAQVTITKGAKTIVTTTVPVAADGSLTLTVKRFAKLVVKRTKKGYPGKYRVTVAYLGNGGVTASSGATVFKVRK